MQTVSLLYDQPTITSASIMQDRNHRSNLHVHWEFVEDSNADDLLRQIARLILEDRPELSPDVSLDREAGRTLNESVPVVEPNQTTIEQ